MLQQTRRCVSLRRRLPAAQPESERIQLQPAGTLSLSSTLDAALGFTSSHELGNAVAIIQIEFCCETRFGNKDSYHSLESNDQHIIDNGSRRQPFSISLGLEGGGRVAYHMD